MAEPRTTHTRRIDHRHDGIAISRVQRGSRFIQQRHRIIANQRARDIDPLLFATGKRRWWYRPQAHWNAQARYYFSCILSCNDRLDIACDQWLGDQIERRTTAMTRKNCVTKPGVMWRTA